VQEIRERLLARLQGVTEVSASQYGDFVAAISAAEPSACQMANITYNQRYSLDDGTSIEVKHERERYIVQFEAATSAVADTIRNFTLKAG
jgi:hypothetical protein